MPNPERRSKHHILFQGKHYGTGYAHRLRSEKYLIPKIHNDLHALINSKVHDVPTPSSADCKRAYNELRRLRKRNQLPGRATLMQRLSFLIDIWEDSCPATVAILKYQRDIAGEYYDQHPSSRDQFHS